jgi:hypothetical protein
VGVIVVTLLFSLRASRIVRFFVVVSLNEGSVERPAAQG